MKRLAALFLTFTLLLPAAPAAAAGVPTVRSRDEFIDFVTEQSEELTSDFTVRIENYSETEYSVDFTKFLPIQHSEMSGELRGTTAELTYSVTYTQAERILHYLNGGDIRLDNKELAAADTALAVYGDIITEDMSDYEKQLAIHDYLVINVEYDDNGDGDTYTPYGALVNGVAVCQGYAEAARILLDMADIENGTLTGRAGGQDHMWNVVVLDGEPYHMDITWDGGLIFDDGTRALSRAYFNLTDEQLGKNHRWNNDLQLLLYGAPCTATEYNYFQYNGLVVTSGEEYEALVAERYKAGEREIEVYFDGIPIESANLEAAALAAGSTGYTGFPIPAANALWMRFK